MFSTSKCVLKNRKLLEAICRKVQSVSLLHVCKNHKSLNERRILSLYGNQRHVGFVLKPVCAARLISTKDAATQVMTEDTTKAATSAASTESVTSVPPIITASQNDTAASQNVEAETDSVVKSSAVTESPQQELTQELTDFPIPDPPIPPPKIETQIVDGVPLSIDPPFEQLGLGGWSPVGWVQNAFEYFHVSFGLPWWECIVIGTLIVRTALFPLVVISQRNTARLQNNQPEFQALQVKLNEARQRGDHMEAARITQDLVLFMRDKKINPIKSALIPLCQAPVFLSFFLGLREMANIPLKSMHNGGILWFTDLTVPDQFYLLPIITSVTLLTAIEVGADSSKMTSQNQYLVKYILRGLPIIMLPFTITFPAAILVYWTTSNLISLGQVALFQIPRVRTFFKIEQKVKHEIEKLPVQPKGPIQAIKDWWKETRRSTEHADRGRRSQQSFTAAGRGAVPKTYKYNPTLPRPAQSSTSATVQAKKA